MPVSMASPGAVLPHSGIKHTALLFKLCASAIPGGNFTDGKYPNAIAVPFRGQGRFILEYHWFGTGIVYQNYDCQAVPPLNPELDELLGSSLPFACLQGIFQQVSKQNGNICSRYEAVVRIIHLCVKQGFTVGRLGILPERQGPDWPAGYWRQVVLFLPGRHYGGQYRGGWFLCVSSMSVNTQRLKDILSL